MKTRARNTGFTLVEVVIALAIIALTAVVLLDRRVEVVRDAGRARDVRIAWFLASQKLAELELDKAVWQGEGSQSSGDFSDLDEPPPARAVYYEFTWEYIVARVPVETVDTMTVTTPQKPKEIYRLGLRVDGPGLGEPVLIEAMFPVDEPRPAAPAPAPAPGNAANPGDPANPGIPPTGGGVRK